jgi:hypothetical protein
MKYAPIPDDELWDAWPNETTLIGAVRAIEQAVLARIAEQGLVIVPKEFLAWMPDGIDDSMPITTLYVQQLNKGCAQ